MDEREGEPGEAALERSDVPPKKRSRVRIALIAAEAALVLGLLAGWIFVEEVRTTGSLVVLFLYSFPAEFLVGLVPHEPVLLYYGELHDAWTVAWVAGVSTTLAEWMNYSFIGFFMDVGLFESMRKKPMVARVIELFGKAPFVAIVVAAFTPIPFFPVRFLVVLDHYPVWRYLVAVFVSRTPRFFLIALLGQVFQFPTWALVTLFAGMIIALWVPLFRHGLPKPGPAELERGGEGL